MLTTKDVNLGEKPADSIALTASVVGKTARQTVAVGAYVPQSAISGTGSIAVDIAGELNPGERAMAISVDELHGVGTLIQPGDRVDVVFTFTSVGADPEIPVVLLVPRSANFTCPDNKLACDLGLKSNPVSVKVVVQNVRVVGTLLSGPNTQAGGAQTTPPPDAGPVLTGRTELVMLAVNAQQAEVLRYGQTLASPMTLLLRSPQDAAAAADDTSGIILKNLLEEYGVLPPLPVSAPLPTAFTPR
jgi:Flp pilus assembly protein CpaB